jgi:hypothetical protein
MRAVLRVHALVSQSQPLYRTPSNQVLLDDLRGIRCLHMAVPYGLRVNHHGGSVLALVKAH